MKTPTKLFIFFTLAKIFLVLGVVGVFGIGRLVWSDSLVYLDLARSIQNGNGYYDPIRTPLYPFVLSLFVPFGPGRILAVAVIQALVSGVMAVLVYRIGLFFLPPHFSIFAVTLLLFEPLNIILNLLILPETFLILFLMLFIYFFLCYLKNDSLRDLVVSTAGLALAIWTKPVATYLFIVPLAVLFLRRASFGHLALFCVLFFILLLPWMFYNLYTFGYLGVSSHGGDNVCGYFLTSIFSTEYGQDPSNMDAALFPSSFEVVKNRCQSSIAGLKIALFEYPRSFAKTIFLSTLSFLTNDGYAVLFQKSPAQSIKPHHNYLTPAVFAARDWRMKITSALGELGRTELIIILLGKLFWIATSVFALAGAWRLRHNMTTIVLFTVLLYFLVVSVLSTGYGVGARLRYPVDPILFILATYELAEYLRSI